MHRKRDVQDLILNRGLVACKSGVLGTETDWYRAVDMDITVSRVGWSGMGYCYYSTAIHLKPRTIDYKMVHYRSFFVQIFLFSNLPLVFNIRNVAKLMMLIGLKENQPGTHALNVEACF
jgi:hypothetical protein